MLVVLDIETAEVDLSYVEHQCRRAKIALSLVLYDV